MSIEATLERIAKAAEQSVVLLQALQSNTGGVTTTVIPAGAPAPEPRKRGRPAAQPPAPAAPPPADLDLGGEATDTSLDFLSEDEQPAPVKVYTREEVRAALVDFQKRTNPDAARKLLKDHGGADTLKSLAEDKFAAVVAAAAKG